MFLICGSTEVQACGGELLVVVKFSENRVLVAAAANDHDAAPAAAVADGDAAAADAVTVESKV